MSRLLETCADGEILSFREDGSLRNFVVVHQFGPDGHPAYYGVENSTILMREGAIGARRMHDTDVNDYQNATIQSFINDDYISRIDADIRNNILEIGIPFRPGSGTSTTVNNGINGLQTRAFLASLREIGVANGLPNISGIPLPDDEGARFSFFLDGDQAGPQRERRIMQNNWMTGVVLWWTRTPDISNDTSFFRINTNGRSGSTGFAATSSSMNIVVFFALPNSLYVIGNNEVVVTPPPTSRIKVNDNGTIRTLKKIQVNDNGTMRTLTKIQVNDNGIIREVFNS